MRSPGAIGLQGSFVGPWVNGNHWGRKDSPLQFRFVGGGFTTRFVGSEGTVKQARAIHLSSNRVEIRSEASYGQINAWTGGLLESGPRLRRWTMQQIRQMNQ